MKEIYIASKTKHADIWRSWREDLNINSSWIDEVGKTEDFTELWLRRIEEASNADILVIYREPNEILQDAWIELGAAVTNNKQVYAYGIRTFSVANHPNIKHFKYLDELHQALLDK
jgi:hypothetical protein